MHHLRSCLKRYRTEAILSPLFKLLEAAMELLVPLVVAKIVDVGIAGGDRAYILHACLLLGAFGLMGLLFALTAQYFAAKAAVGVSADLRERLFAKMQSFSFSQIDEMGAPSMLTRMTSDVQQVQTGVNMTLRLLLRSPIVVFGATAMAFAVDAQAALVFVALIPLLALAVYGVMAACLPRYRRVQERLDGVYLSARENLVGARVLRAFRKEEDEVQAFDRKTEGLLAAQTRVGAIAAVTNPLTFLLVNLAAVVLIFWGGLRVDAGAIGQGDVLALYGYLSLILVELVKLANLIVTVTKAVTCANRVGAVLDASGERETVLPRGEREEGAHVVFEHVGFTYAGGGAPALSDVNVSVRRGQTVGVLGGTGSGKSTLVDLLPRFYEATEGRVLLGGEDVRSIPVRELRQRVGYVPQKVALFRGTIRSNLRWGKPDCTDAEMERALRIAQAEDVAAAKGGTEGAVEQEGRNFSGGQRQRLTIARAVVRDPEVLILDDSSSALDYATDARLRQALAALDCTVFVVSQRASSVRRADVIVVLDEGRVAGVGTHEELERGCGVYREILASQTEASS